MRATQDTPVAVELGGALGQEVRAFAEGEAGWQVVDASAGLAPVLVLSPAVVPGIPTVVVVDGEPTVEVVRAGMQEGALDVLGWPQDRARLLAVPGRVRPAGVETATATFAVAGAAGGVGTSTIALATAALLTWSGARALVVGGEGLLALCGLDPWRGPGSMEVAALDPAGTAVEVARLRACVPGVPGLHVLGGGPVAQASGWPADVVVVDRGVDLGPGVDLLCARPDVHLGAAAATTAPVLLNGAGPLDVPAARRVLGRPPAGVLPASGRVARAGLNGRVPSALPGSWLQVLRAALQGLEASG